MKLLKFRAPNTFMKIKYYTIDCDDIYKKKTLKKTKNAAELVLGDQIMRVKVNSQSSI